MIDPTIRSNCCGISGIFDWNIAITIVIVSVAGGVVV